MKGHFDIVARLAYRQHGRVSRRQLLAAGVEPKRIDRWVAARLLRRQHDGVYAVGHAAPSTDGDYMAAVLACGPGAVLSHRAAAFALQLLRGTPPPPEVTVPTTAGLRRPGILITASARCPRPTTPPWRASRSRPSRGSCSTWRAPPGRRS